MRVVFDAWTSPRLAVALDLHLSATGGRAMHIADLPGGPQAPDIAWAASAPGGLVVTGDARLRAVPALRLAYRRAGLRVLVLGRDVAALAVERQARLLVARWPDVVSALGAAPAPALFELSAGLSSALRPLPV